MAHKARPELNERPRQTLGFKTPSQAMAEALRPPEPAVMRVRRWAGNREDGRADDVRFRRVPDLTWLHVRR
jgi:hypothetical protein